MCQRISVSKVELGNRNNPCYGLKRVVLCYFSDEEDCFPSRSHHSNSENGQNVPGRVSPQTAVGTLL